MKKFISLILILSVLLTLASCVKPQTSGGRFDFKITKDYSIIIPSEASFAEISAAKKLGAAILHATGLDIPIVRDDAPSTEHEIVIGKSQRDGVSLAQNNAGADGYSIYASKEKLFFYGASERTLEIAIDRFIREYVIISSTLTVSKQLSLSFKDIFAKSDLTLNGVDISKYTIVYAAEGTTTHYRSNVNAWVESSKYEDAANAIANEIYLLTKKRLQVLPVSEAEKSDYEILVGKVADREEVSQFYVTHGVGYSDERFAYGMVGTKLLFAGGSPNSTYHASKAFADYCRNMRTSDFTSALVNGTLDLTTVVCIGTSMTHGSSCTSINRYNYAVYLQKMLGLDYYVANCALPNVTAEEYEQSAEYTLSLSLSPDVVIIQLGYDDADPAKDIWKTAESKEIYVQTLMRMIKAYRSKNSSVQIYLVSPAHKATSTRWEENLTELTEITRTLASDITETFIDVHSVSRETPWVFPDGKNLKNEGYELLAGEIFKTVKETVKVKN